MLALPVQDTPRPPAALVPTPRSPWSWLVPCLVVLLYLGASFGPALFDQNEAQYAGAVREMLDRPADYLPGVRGQLERGRWDVPTNDGVPRLQKPPLVYWCLLASMSVFGTNEFAARLPNALAALTWFAGVYLIGRRVGGERRGRAGATILATMAGTFIFCHLVAPEPFLAATLTLTFWCFLRACDHSPPRAGRWMLAAWVFMALGVLCKGLHGALYPLAVAAILAWRFPATRPRVADAVASGGAAAVRRPRRAVVRRRRAAVSRVFVGPVHQRTTRPRLQPALSGRQQPGALRRVLAGAPRVLPAVDVFHPGGAGRAARGGRRRLEHPGPRAFACLVCGDGGVGRVLLVAGLLPADGLGSGGALARARLERR